MREIKFRVWDEDNEVYSYLDFNNLEELRYSVDSFEDYFNRFYLKDNPKYIQQFTGIKDKNNVEIYEGDKVTNGTYIYIVEYNTQNTSFCLEPIERVKGEFTIVDSIDYQRLGNGYYSRKDLEVL